jgi:DNA-binding MarR family transcriptional regulator
MTDLARDAWVLLFELLMRSAPHRTAVLAKHGLTPNDARALASLSSSGKPMRALAKEWGTDPSTVTWVIDRLESLGLAQRTSSSSDRRAKLIVLSEKGKKLKAAVDRAFSEPPPEIGSLSQRDLRALIAIATKATRR